MTAPKKTGRRDTGVDWGPENDLGLKGYRLRSEKWIVEHPEAPQHQREAALRILARDFGVLNKVAAEIIGGGTKTGLPT